MGCFTCGEDDDDHKKHDIKTGLPKNRGCTDIICCVLFLGFIAFWIALSALAFQNGDPYKLIRPTDSNGNVCGVGDKVDETTLLYFDITKCASAADLASSNFQCPTYAMCVEQCPDEYFSYFTNVLPSIGIAFGAMNLASGAGTSLGDYRCGQTIGDANPTGCIDDSKIICKPQVSARWETIYATTDASQQNILDVTAEITSLFVDGECALFYFPSTPSLGRCMPSMSVNATETDALLADNQVILEDNGDPVSVTELRASFEGLLQSEAGNFIQTSFADLQESWPAILIMLAIAVVVSFIWIFLMRWIAAPLIWIFILGLLGLMGFGLYYCWCRWDQITNNQVGEVETITSLMQEFTFDYAQYMKVAEVWLGFGIVLAILTLIYLVLLIFFIKRIRIATKLLAEASKAVGAIMTSLIFPFFTSIFHLIVIFWWAATGAYIASSATPNFNIFNKDNQTENSLPVYGDACDINEWDNPGHIEFNNTRITCQFSGYTSDYPLTNSTVVIQFVNLFGFYWTINFVTAVGQCTLAGAFASWYFAFKKPDDVPALPLFNSFLRSFWHLGTLAFGSLIIAIVQILRAILDYIDRKTKQTQSSVGKCLMCFCKCCLWCLEKCVRYISKNAYILTAMFGYNFCKSSCKAVKLIVSNAARAAALDGTTGFMLFLGKMMVALGCGALTWAFFSGQIQVEESWLQQISVNPSAVNAIWLPTLIVTVGAYIIAVGFFNVYSMAVSTVFLCFLEDLDRNDGSPEKPYFMSKDLMSLMGKKNKKVAPSESKM